jgi:heat shock protein HtpX
LSRTREFIADAGAVQLTKKPDALISALRRISSHDEIPGLLASFSAMMISSHIEGLFSTHPAVEDRIAAIEKFAGGREMGPAAAAPTGGSRPAGMAGAKPAQRHRPNSAFAPLQPQVPFGRRKSPTLSGLTEAR